MSCLIIFHTCLINSCTVFLDQPIPSLNQTLHYLFITTVIGLRWIADHDFPDFNIYHFIQIGLLQQYLEAFSTMDVQEGFVPYHLSLLLHNWNIMKWIIMLLLVHAMINVVIIVIIWCCYYWTVRILNLFSHW